MRQVTVSIPATSANLGPGFDCLGLALDLRHVVTFSNRSDRGLKISAQGEDAEKIPLDSSNLVYQACEIIFRRCGNRPTGLTIHQDNNIPIGSGLGSSSSAILAGLFGANVLSGNHLSASEILQIATDLEGHPDNVAPAVYGGLVLGVQGPSGLIVDQIEVPPLRVAIVLPDYELLTIDARAALPVEVPLNDAIFNSSRLGLLIRALQAADYKKLKIAMQDRLHQPYRVPLIPGMKEAFDASKAAGAAGVALSGAGPSLLAFAPEGLEAIADAAAASFQKAGLSSRIWLLSIDTSGVIIKDDGSQS
ncbi:MAG: homoserine kinase [Candidatus Promineifilaceae bacterium]|nr:homoserine kinase [Candidatus Promineifilaceae bacterium]